MEQLHVVHLEVFPSFGQIAKVKSFFLRLKWALIPIHWLLAPAVGIIRREGREGERGRRAGGGGEACEEQISHGLKQSHWRPLTPSHPKKTPSSGKNVALHPSDPASSRPVTRPRRHHLQNVFWSVQGWNLISKMYAVPPCAVLQSNCYSVCV